MIHKFLTYGINTQTGTLVSVEKVVRGLKCECICPVCRSVLIARQGSKMQWHFAHANSAECTGARMTTLHLLAQQILQKEKKIMLPAYKGRCLKKKAFSIQFDDVILEQQIPVNGRHIQPDGIGRINKNGKDHNLLIEIFVTHKVDEQKLQDIKDLNCACIEIDLSDLLDTDYTEEKIKERLFTKYSDRKWLNNPFYKQQDKELQIRKEKEEEERREKELQAERERHSEAVEFVRPFLSGELPPSTFNNHFCIKPYSLQEEILKVLRSVYYYSFFDPSEDDIQNAYYQARLLEYLPETFPLDEIFENAYDGKSFIEYIDSKNDSKDRTILFTTVLKCVYRKNFIVQRYSWDDRDYYSAIDVINNVLESYRKKQETLRIEQKNSLERHVLVFCYDIIQIRANESNKKTFFQYIENYQYWSIISCLFSLYLHHIIFSKLSNFVQLTENFLTNHAEYAHLYLKFARSYECSTNNYTSASGENKLEKMEKVANTVTANHKLDDIVKLLFPKMWYIWQI